MTSSKKQNKTQPSLILREFIYLDRPRLEDFLSGIEGGSGETTRDFITEATDASLFQRLYSLDQNNTFITHISKFDEAKWAAMEEGQLVEVEATVDTSALEKIFDTISDLLELMAVIQPGALVDKKSQELIKILQLRKRNTTTGIRIEPLKSPAPKYQLVASLQDDNLRAAKNELTGNFIVFGRIRKKLKRNEKFDLFKLLPTEFQLGSKEMGEMLKSFKEMPSILGKPPTIKDIKVGYPAMVITPVAIYR